MVTINPYLNFNGNTEEAFLFYRAVFGGEFKDLVRFKDTAEKDKLKTTEQEKLMHISLPIGKENILMGTDALESMGHIVKPGTNIQFSIDTQSKEEADKIFYGLSMGGKVGMPMGDTFWGAYFGMLTDKFGIQWMVSYNKPKA